MPLPTGDVIGILADNLRRRKSVLPISSKSATRWARGLDLPRGGDTVLYTGLMYQLIPYIEGLVNAEKRLGDSSLSKLTGLARMINRLINVSTFMVWPSAGLRAEYDQVPINVARLLRQAGVEFGYLYEDDLYSGALTHDLGADEVVAEHARRVYAMLKKHGVKKVITIDPHTTNMLRSVYPEAASRLRHRGEDLPRGPGRDRTCPSRTRSRASWPSTIPACSRATRTSCKNRATCSRAPAIRSRSRRSRGG